MADANPDEFWTKWETKQGEESSTAAVLLEEYKDAGYWGRHYSTVRLTLGTFFLTAAGGMIYHQWEKPNWMTAIGALVIALIGFGLFVLFSFLTFNEMNAQREIVSVYRKKLGKDDKGKKALWLFNRFWTKTALPIGLLFLGGFFGFTLLWASSTFRDAQQTSSPAETKLPISVQVGSGSPVTIDVPVKVAPK
jgi:hypothetical protein